MKGHTPIPENEASFTTDDVVRATNGKLVGGEGRATRHVGVTTDSRSVRAGSIFVALVGEKNDAHAFVDAAIQRGASLVLVREGFRPASAGALVVEVKDTLVALGGLAKHHLAEWRKNGAKKVIAITGSAGKTTTKELVRALLAVRATPHATLGNLNNRIGVPFVVLGLLPSHSHLVAEVGMSLRGEIAALAAIVDPDVAIITNIGNAHAEGVGGEAMVAVEKGDLFGALRDDALAIENLLDERVREQCTRTRARRISFGKEGAAYELLGLRIVDAKGSVVSARVNDVKVDVRMPFLGEAQALDLLAAWAAVDAALDAPLTRDDVISALRQLSPLSGRARVTTLGDGTVVIDDSYNANPTSVRASIASAADLARAESRRLVLVLGEMKELGAAAEDEHRALTDVLREVEPALVVSCGGLMRLALEHYDGPHRSEEDVERATRSVLSSVRPGDVVLIKGSRSVGTEAVVSALEASRGGA